MRQTVDVERGTVTYHHDVAAFPASVVLRCGFYPQPWDDRHWNWNNTTTSLAICQRYAKLTPAQRRIHDVEALSAPSHLRRLMPAATRALHADPQFVATAQAMLAAIEEP